MLLKAVLFLSEPYHSQSKIIDAAVIHTTVISREACHSRSVSSANGGPPMPVIIDAYMIDGLRRKARNARLQACRASPTLERQLKSLAELYEADAERMAAMRDAMAQAGRAWFSERPAVT